MGAQMIVNSTSELESISGVGQLARGQRDRMRDWVKYKRVHMEQLSTTISILSSVTRPVKCR